MDAVCFLSGFFDKIMTKSPALKLNSSGSEEKLSTTAFMTGTGGAEDAADDVEEIDSS